MNRRNWIIVGIVILVLIVVGSLFLFNDRSSDTIAPMLDGPVSKLAYCTDEQVKPCVVSFSIDVNNQMLVNLLLPDTSLPDFYVQIAQGGSNISYECKRVVAAPNNVYCVGEKLSPGEVLYVTLVSIKDNTLLAGGNLSIIGLSFPTLEVSTSIPLPTVPPAMPESTATFEFILPTSTSFDFLLPTSTPFDFPAPAPTLPSYP